VANCPTIAFRSTQAERVGASDYAVTGDLTIRGVTRLATLDLRYLGRWRTPYNEARVTRVGFTGGTRINRHDFGVSWNSPMENAGLVVGNEVLITVDVEAILAAELNPILGRTSSP
jgi:polyisoprenoid-binding protein YceI